jgi:mono/diheme cytochrome c family protein
MHHRKNKFLLTNLVASLIGIGLVACIVSCSPPNSSNTSNASPKFQQYYIQGEKLYNTHCSNCHQFNGKGLGRVYPPIDSSDYMTENVEEVICLIKHGKDGELLVNGKLYNQRMPGVETLTPLEIAEISTYIYNTWSNDHGLIDVKQVELVLQDCITTKKE